ncbi:FliM/FliN family flagellar motor switch protein [Lysobacter enzymogenes]|uniref:FliM/FliN family flagellar motor switch protein n=1 Tax=Lysobacter enzymogenes TaxID=69 RepID=UPI0019D2DAB1|nr:FliM/FliN family flagellar motor switch protein [Lysobacter enzymogenes]
MSTSAAIDIARPQPPAETAPASAPVSAPPQDISLIGHVQVQLAAQVGTATMSVERLFALKAGDIVGMNEALEAPVTLMLNGRAVARGELLAVDDHFGVRILELA